MVLAAALILTVMLYYYKLLLSDDLYADELKVLLSEKDDELYAEERDNLK
jgi:hypothetical protein